MNKRHLFGVSFAAIFAVAMVASSAYAGESESPLEDGVIKDHAAKNPTPNAKENTRAPAHWDIETTFSGNFTQYAVDVSDATGIGAGIVVPGSPSDLSFEHSVFYGVTLHPGDDCDDSDCSEFAPHGHKVTAMISEDCLDGLEVTSLEDIGDASGSDVLDLTSSTIKLNGIPLSEPLANPYDSFSWDGVCNVPETDDPVNLFLLVEIYAGENEATCVLVTGVSAAYGVDGNTNGNLAKNGKVGGLTDSNTPSFCTGD